jgi:hypothetical protein
MDTNTLSHLLTERKDDEILEFFEILEQLA